MSGKMSQTLKLRLRRKRRIRKSVSGTAERPRLTVHRSSRSVYAQVIDDATGRTLASVHSYKDKKNTNKEGCHELGKKLAEACKSHNIEMVVFDKNGYQYHGRVKALAEGAREGGLKF